MAGTATLGLSNILSAGLKLALLNWERMSEFTADRAGFLCCQNIRAVMTVFMKLSGLPARYYRDCESRVDAFIAQAEAFDALDSSGMHKFVKYATILSDNHPWLIMRGRELLAWQQSGAYEGLLDACAPRPVRLPDGE
ncbi:MAG: hypothetical protein Q4F72_08430, partial [Desulfovibrionaceae bacterium]|nr:hypothetical protein [Desulfovibrionaceae bacterium]